MVKLGKVFSIVAVLTLLILLAPALAPPVASADGPLPNPLTISFSATISEGNNFSFTVVPNATYGSVLNQFTRDPMVIHQPANNDTPARFFNLSTASGTISGDLSGSIEFKWSRLTFGVQYFNSSDWFIPSPAGVGILYLSANVTGTTLGNFVIVGAADSDYNSTVVKGEGLVSSREAYAAPPPAPARVLIGEMSYQISGGTITGTFTLRNYSKTPVGLEGKVSTTMEYLWLEGQLINDESDAITNDTVNFVQFTGNPVNAPNRKVLEEMTQGREVDQAITAGDMGVGGSISLMRTGVLDVVEVVGQDIPMNSVTGTRTIENNTGSNITAKRGLAKTIVLVDMAGFNVSTGVDQRAFTFMPSYSYNYMGTGYYAGIESYVIAATHINLTLYLTGPDYRYPLLPTPLVSSVSPSEQGRGNTTNVTINGKWFWTDPAYNPLTVSFGPGITTNYYTVVNDTQVIANITVAGDAFVGPRDVKVTKRGVTGTLSGGFTVSGPTGFLNGTFTFAAGSMDGRGLAVNFYDPGTKALLFTGSAVTDASGNFTIEAGIGTYDIGAKNCTCLSEMVYGKQLTEGNTTFATFTNPSTSREGDINEDDWVTAKDRGPLYNGWGTQDVIQDGHFGDLNRDGWLTAKDRGLMYDNWGQSGDQVAYHG